MKWLNRRASFFFLRALKIGRQDKMPIKSVLTTQLQEFLANCTMQQRVSKCIILCLAYDES